MNNVAAMVFSMQVVVLAAEPLAAPRQVEILVRPEKPAQGQLVIVQAEGLKSGDRVTGSFDGRTLRFYRDESSKVRALSAVRLGRPAGEAMVKLEVKLEEGGRLITARPVQVVKGKFESQRLSVDPRYVRPPRRLRARIRAERKKLKRLWRAPPTPRKWRGNFCRPLEGKEKITTPFGVRRLFNGRLRGRHWGVDFDAAMGEPVRAIGAGRVVLVEDRYYSGKTVVIDHGLRLFSMYFHLSEVGVEKGSLVEKCQVIGKAGSTGRSTGPHLHLGAKVEGLSFDPLSLLGADLAEGE